MPFVPSSFLFLVAMPGAPRSNERTEFGERNELQLHLAES